MCVIAARLPSNLLLDLTATTGEKPEHAALLSAINLTTARSGQVLQLGTSQEHALTLELTPTPRWPDLLVAYYAPSRILFSSKLFSAHVSPPQASVLPSFPLYCMYSTVCSLASVSLLSGADRTLDLHVQGEVLDDGGWEAYKEDWRYYFECMLAPMARQVRA